MSVLSKLETLLDETIGLVRDVRAYVGERRQREAWPWSPDLFGPNGTGIRFDPPIDNAHQQRDWTIR